MRIFLKTRIFGQLIALLKGAPYCLKIRQFWLAIAGLMYEIKY